MSAKQQFYIAYFGQGFPGDQTEPTRHNTIADTITAFRQFAHDTMTDSMGQANASVYHAYNGRDHTAEETWQEAESFRGVGVPFDYPTFQLSYGPRGGIIRENA